ncbi:unnamed protein product [Ambrosiozyma monospora]|uniref:Unnamed protein product n=1 Tax=Ambrosiozyma monospora TaxID=43982 RepID=A0ACB5T662_AMBMO|nr:unnamed protein product [Ambrosiozyma monospora]
MKSKEHRIIINKLFFLNRTLQSFLVDTESAQAREILYCNAIYNFCKVITSDIIDVDAYRLAMGVWLTVCNTSFGPDKRWYDETGDLYLILCEIFMPLNKQFMKLMKYGKTHGWFEPKRTYTQLFPTTYPFPEYTIDSSVQAESFSELMIEFTVVLMIVLQMSAGGAYPRISRILLNQEERPDSYRKLDEYAPSLKVQMSTDYIFDSMEVLCDIVDPIFFPGPKWLTFKAYCICCIEIYCRAFQPMIKVMFGTDETKTNPELVAFANCYFTCYFTCVLKCINSKPASIEHLGGLTLKGCYNLTKGLRTKAVTSIHGIWNVLGVNSTAEEKMRFGLDQFGGLQRNLYSDDNYVIVLQVLLCAMQQNVTCCEMGSKTFWSIIVCEWCKLQSLYELERVTISSLYEIFLHRLRYSPGIGEINNFISHLKSCITLDVEDEAYQPIMQFINTMFEFLSTAAELKCIPEGSEFEDDRAFYKIKISSYLLNVDKPELLQSFINSMYEGYLDKKNYTQAALSLELLANTYSWNPTSFLPACEAPAFPSQSEFKRKEALYRLIATNFNKGNKTEQAVEVFLELLNAYNQHNFNLTGLSYCHTQLAKAFIELETAGKMESTYFKISFIGYGFPQLLRGKEFIYEGMPFEHITSINHRLTRMYPGSRIISNEEKAQQMLTKTPFGKYLHIKTVNPRKSQSEMHRFID